MRNLCRATANGGSGMFLVHLNHSHRGWGARVASHLAAVAAGAAGVALWQRATTIGGMLRRGADRPIQSTKEGAPWPASMANAGWAEIVDAHGSVLGRARVMLAEAGQPPVDGQPLSGELRSVRLSSGALRLFPGRYWARFEKSQHTYAIEVVASPSADGTEVVAIRWDDLDLPASLVERNAN